MERVNVEEYKKALEAIEKYDTIIIHRHTNPDGDAIGSQKGLKEIITLNYPKKKVYMVGDDPGRYSFMCKEGMDRVDDEVFKTALSIVLDVSSDYLISDTRYREAHFTLRFDHHVFINKFCDLEVTDCSFESCAGLLSDFALSLGLSLNAAAAEALYTGIVTDSGRFYAERATERTFRTAAELLRYDFDRKKLFENLYDEDYSAIKRKAYYMSRIEMPSPLVAYTYNTEKDVKKMGTTPFNVSRGLVNTMSTIHGVDIWLSFTEDGERILVELRSRNTPVYPIALSYGGGGHEHASGCSLSSKDECMKLLRDVIAAAETNYTLP